MIGLSDAAEIFVPAEKVYQVKASSIPFHRSLNYLKLQVIHN